MQCGWQVGKDPRNVQEPLGSRPIVLPPQFSVSNVYVGSQRVPHVQPRPLSQVSCPAASRSLTKTDDLFVLSSFTLCVSSAKLLARVP